MYHEDLSAASIARMCILSSEASECSCHFPSWVAEPRYFISILEHRTTFQQCCDYLQDTMLDLLSEHSSARVWTSFKVAWPELR